MVKAAGLEGLRAYLAGGLFAIIVFVVGLWILLTYGDLPINSGGLLTFVTGFLVFMLVYFVSMVFVDRFID